MSATEWEFRNRAMVFGLIFAFTFPLSALDPVNATAEVSNHIAAWAQWNADTVARVLFFGAAAIVCAAALLRTWASSYLQAEVVYAADVKSASLVADGPYRRVRNPLYLANVLLALGFGAMESRLGLVLAVLATTLFCLRLIRREESELAANLGDGFTRYRAAVPCLWPALTPRVATAGRQASWRAGWAAESWYWGFAAALLGFALTLNITVFLVIVALSVGTLAFGSWKFAQRRS